MKPREFWIVSRDDELSVLDHAPVSGYFNSIHVREVVEISEAEIEKQKAEFAYENDPGEHRYLMEGSFEAGARWAIAKMRGGE